MINYKENTLAKFPKISVIETVWEDSSRDIYFRWYENGIDLVEIELDRDDVKNLVSSLLDYLEKTSPIR